MRFEIAITLATSNNIFHSIKVPGSWHFPYQKKWKSTSDPRPTWIGTYGITLYFYFSTQVLNHIEDEVTKYEVFTKLIDNGMFTFSDVKALVAGLTFILQSALRNDVDPSSLDSELQQLGFPKVWY